MSPAFDSPKQAAAYAVLLALLLLSPVILPAKWELTREQAFQTESWGAGPYPWIHQQIFEETSDIDVVFMGSSHMMHGIDTRYVQSEFSKKLGRPAVVISLAWGGPGFDALYFMSKALLGHRKVHCLVFYDEKTPPGMRNVQSSAWFRWSEDFMDVQGVSWIEDVQFYIAAVVAMPRNLLGLLHRNLPSDMSPAVPHIEETIRHAPNPATQLGTLSSEVGFNRSTFMHAFAPFERFTPEFESKLSSVVVYSSATRQFFHFSDDPVLPWEAHYAQKLGALASQHGTKLIMLHIPNTRESRSDFIEERVFWPKQMNADVTLLGIPPARMFSDFTDSDVEKLFIDWQHLSRNGLEFFTRLITPSIWRVYESAK